MLQTGEVGAEEVILIIKCKLGDFFRSGFRGSKWYESDRDSSEQSLYVKSFVGE